jgi:hypothetical protein
MSIKKVKTIPKSLRVQKAEPFEYQKKLLKDFQKAWVRRYDKFEFTGYDNPNYLVSYAKKIAYQFLKKDVLVPAYAEATEKLQKKFKKDLGDVAKYIKVRPPYESAEPAIKIYGVTILGEKRVFGEINWDYIDNMSDRIVEANTQYFNREDVQRKLAKAKEDDDRRARREYTIREYSEMMRKKQKEHKHAD